MRPAPEPGTTRARLCAAAASRLQQAGHEDPKWWAAEVVTRCLGFTRTDLLREPETAISPEESRQVEDWLQRFLQHEPLAYLEGRCAFYGREFEVSPAVLIPRPDSETLVEWALEGLTSERPQVLELGLGSGCLLFSILAEIGAAYGLGVDLSAAALRLAQRNREALGLRARCDLLQADWGLALVSAQAFDLLLSNPPYILPHEPLGPGVADHEPHLALFAPKQDPWAPYRAILECASRVLRPGGRLLVEVGAGHAATVASLGLGMGFQGLGSRKDLAGLERVVGFQRTT